MASPNTLKLMRERYLMNVGKDNPGILGAVRRAFSRKT